MGKTTRIGMDRSVRAAVLMPAFGVALAALSLILVGSRPAEAQDAFTSYEVDLTDRSGDSFKVTVSFSGLSASDDIFQFATTAPGTYQVMDIGRFVFDFRAADAQGRPVAVEKVDANRWRFEDPERVKTVRYSIAETWDTPVDEHPVYRRSYDPNYSLSRLALTSFADEGQAQYGNIYQRGAVVAGLLDIRLLELSGGRSGLRELVMELAEEYGQDRPFDEAGLFDLIEARTFGEIGDFFDDYIRAAEPLPIAEYYLKLGIRYDPSAQPRFEIMDDATPEQLTLRSAWLSLRPIA